MSIQLDQEQKSDIEQFETGKRFLFWNSNYPDEEMFSFSSSIKNIGIIHDCKLKNKTIVFALNEPIGAFHPKFGPINVIKILADKIFYINTLSLVEIKDEK